MDNLLLLVVALPLAVALLNAILPVVLRKLLIGLALLLGLVWTIRMAGAAPPAFEMLGRTGLALDKLGFLCLVSIHVLGLLIFIFCLKGLNADTEKAFLILYPMTVSFCCGTVLAAHSASLLVFWGLSGLMLYWFALLGRGKEAPGTAKKTFIIVGGSDAFLIMGLAMLGLKSGWSLDHPPLPLAGPFAWVAFLFLLIAALAKAGGFPLHTWVPDFSRDAPVEGVALLPASLDKILGLYLLVRMMTVFFEVGLPVRMAVITLGALTVITAVMMALSQRNGRRLLGYDAVSQVGYMIMGIASGSALAFAGGLFHLINHTLYKSNLFLTLGSVEKRAGTNELDELGGLGRAMPITFISSLTGALAISGIPPFNGFFSKWMIYQGLLAKAAVLPPGYQIWLLACLILAIFGSALTLATLMMFIHSVFLGKRPHHLEKVRETSFNQWLATGLLALLCLGFGLFARQIPLRFLVGPAAQESGFGIAGASGLYSPQLILALLALPLILGLLFFLLVKKPRTDDVYLGGHAPDEQFRASGADFYKEIVEMRPLRSVFKLADKKVFDIYHVGGQGTFGLSHLLQKAHPGLLPLYILFIVFGLVAFLFLGR
jgi:formate hydrogenlyase subunit 3/multisubunit Na+/H+ antiporter MnhD subunit